MVSVLAKKWADHPQATKAWETANAVIMDLMTSATAGNYELAEKFYREQSESFMNNLVDSLHKLSCETYDKSPAGEIDAALRQRRSHHT